MAFKFAIGNVVIVPVKFTLNDGGKAVNLGVTLICDRLGEDELKERIENPDGLVKDFMASVTTDWKDQSFLVDEVTGQPAAFSPANLSMLLGFHGLANLAYLAYLKESAVKAKN
jgi:hypothetical protein